MQGAFLAVVIPVGGSGGLPDNSLPPFQGRPDNGLPWFPGRPDNSLPWVPAYPGNGLPPIGVQPPVFPTPPMAPGGSEGGVKPGHPSNPISGGFILAWSPVYGWIYIPSGGGSAGKPDVPDNSLPTPPVKPDNSLPPSAQPKS
jgi:hypothetical protein